MPNRDDMMRLPFDPIVPAVRADTERRREDEMRVPTVQRDPKLVAFETQRHDLGGGGSFDELVREYIRSAASNHTETWREKFLNMPATEVSFGIDQAQGPDQTVVLTYRHPDGGIKEVFIKNENQSTTLRSLRTVANTPQAAKTLPEIPDVKPRGWLPMPEDLDTLAGVPVRWVKTQDLIMGRNLTAFCSLRWNEMLGFAQRGTARLTAYSTDWECPND